MNRSDPSAVIVLGDEGGRLAVGCPTRDETRKGLGISPLELQAGRKGFAWRNARYKLLELRASYERTLRIAMATGLAVWVGSAMRMPSFRARLELSSR